MHFNSPQLPCFSLQLLSYSKLLISSALLILSPFFSAYPSQNMSTLCCAITVLFPAILCFSFTLLRCAFRSRHFFQMFMSLILFFGLLGSTCSQVKAPLPEFLHWPMPFRLP